MEKVTETQLQPASLKEVLAENDRLKTELTRLNLELDCTKTELSRSQNTISQLLEQLRIKNRRMYGISSEKSDEQLRLFNEVECEADPSVPEPTLETITYSRKKRIGKREEDVRGLEVHRIEYELAEEERICPECAGKLHDIGNPDVRREITCIPAQYYLTIHSQHKYACRHCDRHGTATPIIRKEAPKPLISHSLASPSLVASVIKNKYCLALPLYRQEQDLAAQGITIPRQNMANWVIKAAEWAQPLYAHMKTSLLKHDVLHADETPMQTLHVPGKKSSTKTYMWLYRTSGDATHPLILYDWRKSRAATCPADFLGKWSGYLMTDGYEPYHKLATVTSVGCMAHVRRKFEEAYKALPEKSRAGSREEAGLAYANKLFALEREYKDESDEQRYRLRREKSKPIFEEWVKWATNLSVLPQSLLGKARHYLLSQRPYLENIYLDGRLELSNNRAERSIKPFVIGRKNWLHANTVKGAKASALLYSLIETAKENNLKIFEYLTYLFEQLPNTTTAHIKDLVPNSGKLPTELYIKK